MRSRASFISPVFMNDWSSATTSGSRYMPTPNAWAMQSEVMSSWVGPMPPVVIT